MTERTHITNLLLLLLLTSVMLASGGLQCAFDCLTQADHRHSAAVRVDECHLVVQPPDREISCANKACHQSSPQQLELGGPQLFSLNKLHHPLSGASRLQMPLFRAGTQALQPVAPQPVLLAELSNEFFKPSQQIRSLRTTVLLN